MSCYVIGIAGASCSGKTTVCNKILDKVKQTTTNHNSMVCVLGQDNYYIDGDENDNRDIPEAIDFNLMTLHLKKLMNGESVDMPIYDFKTHKRTQEIKKIGPAEIIIVEGILIFTQELRNLCNLRIFVESGDALCCIRRLIRDNKERGRTHEEIQKRYLEHVVPCFNTYINPSKIHAHIILLNNTHDSFIGLEILLDHIEKKICAYNIYDN